jgi:putative DNA primase/helicase
MTESYTRSAPKPRRARWRPEAEFIYCDENGHAVFHVHRQLAQFGTNRPAVDERTGKQKKRCFQSWKTTADGKKPKNAPVLPYRLPELIAAVKVGRTVFVLEGEPKVEALRRWGLAATCNAEGAGKWEKKHAERLRGADVVILPDNDQPGRRHANMVGRSLEGIAARVRLLELPDLPEHGDIVDWIKAGGTREQFEQLVGTAPEWKPYEEAEDDNDGRVVIRLLAGNTDQIATAVEDALIAAKAPVYTQSGMLVRPDVEEADATRGRTALVTRIKPCERYWLRRELTKLVRCIKIKVSKDGLIEVAADVPIDLANTVLESASSRFAELAGIISTPTMRPDGSLLLKPGYDPTTGLLLVNPPPMPSIPERPTRHDAEAAVQVLEDLLNEFPFVDEASRSVALSALITPVVRAAMPFVPIHVVTAPIAGSGKSFLNDVVAVVAIGDYCPVLSAGANNEETEKRLHGAVLSGQPLIALDNLNGVLRGDFLSQMLTQRLLQVRRLGSTGNLQVRNTATILANGNNIEIEGDMVRRSIQCALDPQVEDPTTRQFRRNPVKMVLADRGKYVAAALIVVRAHLVAGAPGAESVGPYAGFEDWSRLVRGALVSLGRADPVATQQTLHVADPAVVALDLVMEAWAKLINEGKITERPLTVKELIGQNQHELDRALREATHTRENDVLNAVRVGKFLTRHQKRVRNGARLQVSWDAHRKQHSWQLSGWRELVGTGDSAMEADGTVVMLARSRKATRRTAIAGGTSEVPPY